MDDQATRTPAWGAADAVMYRALEQGLSVKVSMGNILILAPPLVITQAEMAEALAILERCLEDVGQGCHNR